MGRQRCLQIGPAQPLSLSPSSQFHNFISGQSVLPSEVLKFRHSTAASCGECVNVQTVSCHGETYGLVWTFQNAFTPQLPMFIKARHAKYEGQQCSGHVCSHPLTGGGPCPASRLAPRDRFWVDFCPYGQSIRGVWTCMHFCILCTEAYSLC